MWTKILSSAIVFGMLVGCSEGMHQTAIVKSSFSSNGERIYFTSTSDSGALISFSGGHHHMRMHGGACVTCHGSDREGGRRMWPYFWVVAPALTAEALTSTHDDGHAHTTYNASTLGRAIQLGVNPDGDELDELMPRWQMPQSDLDALVAYLLDAPGS